MSVLQGSTYGDMPYTGFGTFMLPDQTVSYEEAMKEPWQKACMDFFSTQFLMKTKDRQRKQDNYNLANGQYAGTKSGWGGAKIYEQSNMGEIPNDIVHYPICNLPLKAIWGEELKRPLNFFVKAEDEDNVNQHVAHSTDQLFNLCTQGIQKGFFDRLKQEGINPDENYLKNSIEYNLSLESIDEYRKYSFTTVAERCGNAILKKLTKSQNLIKKFRDGWHDATIVAEEFYWTGVIDGEPVCRNVNPCFFGFEKSYDIDFIDEGSWAYEGSYMTPQQIIERFKSLKPKDAEKLLSYNTGQYTNFADEKTGQIYTNNEQLVAGNYPLNIGNDGYYGVEDERYPLDGSQLVFGMDSMSAVINGNKHYLVVQAEWMKQRKIGILTYFNDESQSWENIVIDGNVKLSEQEVKAGWSINELYINEPWQGTKIAADIYVDVKPKSDYYINPNKIGRRRLGYTGLVYNRRNARPLSFLDEAKPFQELFNIVMSALKKDINSDLGNILIMDSRQVPTTEGFDLDSWYIWLRESKIMWIDSQKSGGFNQFTIAQSSLLNAIQAKLALLEFLQNQIFQIMGVSPQRMGTPTGNSTNTTATENQNAIVQSYSQTEDYFFQHNLVKERVLQNLIEDAKVAYANQSKTMTYFLDDMSMTFLEITKDFTFADLCVYVSNSGKDIKDLETLKSLAQPAIQNGASLYDVATIITGDSMHEIKDKLKAIKKTQEANIQAQQQLEQAKVQQAQKAVEMQIQATTEDREDKQAFEAEQNQLDRENDILLAELKAIGNDAISTDTPDTVTIVDTANIALEQSRHNFEVLSKDKELSLKDKEISIKENIEKEKIKQIKEQNKSQEKIARESNKLKEKEIRAKIQIARMRPKPTKKK